MSFNLGLNVVEVDGRVSPSIEPAPTSVAAFIIRAQRGIPDEVVQVTNWSQFQQRFGSYLKDAYGAYAVRGFFDNGGAKAYITRVANTEIKGATVASLTSTGTSNFNLDPTETEGTKTISIASSRLATSVDVSFSNAKPAVRWGPGPASTDPEQLPEIVGKTLD